MGIPAYQVVSSLTLVCVQRLLRRLAGEKAPPPSHGARQIEPSSDRYHGRVVCAHVVKIDETLREAVIKQPSVSQLDGFMKLQQPDLRVSADLLMTNGVTDSLEVSRILGSGHQGGGL
jgi:type II secretory ATPase GspE/PulE/Tfp pilus assembly ATPase PilB-like protein